MQYNINFQIASICFFTITVIQYCFKKQISLLSHKLFHHMLVVASINLVFDIATLYCLSNYDSIPSWFNRFTHQIFIGSLDLFIALFCMYVTVLIKKIHKFKPLQYLIIFMPFFISIIAIIFGQLDYYISDEFAYSYGLMANTVYICIALYLIISLYLIIKYRKGTSPKLRNAVIVSIVCEIFTALIQLFNPHLLVSNLGLVLMVAFISNSLADPKNYIEQDTGILNRYSYKHMVRECLGKESTFFLIIISLDNWSIINSRFDHEFAIKFIKDIVRKLESLFSLDVYRTDNKCLCIIVKKNPDVVYEIADKIFSLFENNWLIDNTNVTIDARIGIVECPKYFTQQEDIFRMQDLFLRKDIRDLDNNTRYMIFSEKNEQIFKRHCSIEVMLKDAVESNGFDVVYQPIYSTQHEHIHSAEALVRLKDTTTLGFVSPDEFIPIAERYGFINDLGLIVFEKVCKFVSEKHLKELGIEFIEVNLSAIQCMDSNLAEKLLSIIKKYELPADFFNLEITESTMLEKNETMKNNISSLVSAGCKFSMDDYGTGYSNLSQMAEMPYNIIKLDKSLIWSYFEQPKIKVILSSTVDMVKKLGLEIVTEGVETDAQVDLLKSMGVEYLQGYYFSKPISEDAFLYLIKK